MAKKVPLSQLESSLNKILKEYADDIQGNMDELTKKFVKKGAQAVRSEAESYGWGSYSSGWTSQVEEGRFSAQGTIYNEKLPGLPHLLEYGHVMRNGKRSKAFPHIAPVEEKICEEFRKAVENDIQRGG